MPFLLKDFTSGLFSGAKNMEDIMATADEMRRKHLENTMLEKGVGQSLQAASSDSSTDQLATAPAKPAALDTSSDTAVTGATAAPGAAAMTPIKVEPLAPSATFRPAPVAPPPASSSSPTDFQKVIDQYAPRKPQQGVVPSYLPPPTTMGSADIPGTTGLPPVAMGSGYGALYGNNPRRAALQLPPQPGPATTYDPGTGGQP